MKRIILAALLALFVVGAAVCQPTAAATIVCRVVDPSGRPVAGAAVYIYQSSALAMGFGNVMSTAPSNTLTTDSAGTFSTNADAGTSPQNSQFCMVDAKDFAPSGTFLTAGPEVVIKLYLPTTISGTVVDHDNRPIAGATVSAEYAFSGTMSPVWGWEHLSLLSIGPLKDRYTVKTDARGVYSIADLPASAHISLNLDDARFVTANVPIDPGITTAAPFIATPAAFVSGRIQRQDGKPVGPVQVMAQGVGPNGQYVSGGSAVPDADGNYRIGSLPAGTFTISVSPKDETLQDWAPPQPVTVQVTMAGPNTAPNLTLTAGELASGQIVDATTNLPVAGVTVVVQDSISMQPVGQRSAWTLTDAEGRYTLNVWTGAHQVTLVNAPAIYAIELNTAAATFTSTDGQNAVVDTIRLQRGCTAAGRVVDEDGKPVEGINVQALRTAPNVGPFTPKSALTTSDGSYNLTGLLPGTYSVTTDMPEDSSGSAAWAPPAPQTFTVATDKQVEVPNIVLEQGTVVSGTMIAADTKQPIADVRIGIQSPSTGPEQTRYVNATTDKDGRFSIRAWAGSLELFVYNVPPPYAVDPNSNEHDFKVTAGQPLTIDPILLPRAITISSVAVDENGQPIPNLTLQVQREMNDGGEWMNIPPVTTDANGAFTVPQLVAGTYSIDPGADWTVVSPADLAAPSAGNVKLVLKKTPTTALQGTVVDTGGKPLAGVMVEFQTIHMLSNGYGSQDQVQAVTDSDGFFALPAVPFSQGSVKRQSVTKDGYIYQNGGDVTTTGNHVSVSLIVMARLGGSVAGQVLNGLGKTAAGAWVACPAAFGDIRPIQADNSGKFVFHNLAIGSADIYAAKGRYFGHQSSEASDMSSAVTAVNLSGAPMAPVSVDFDGGSQLVSKLYTDAKTSAIQDLWRFRDQCAFDMETVSSTAGLKFLESNTQVNSGDINWIIPAQSSQNPAATAQWVAPLLQSINDNGYAGELATTVGLDVAPVDAAAANVYYGIAEKKISLDKLSTQNVNDAESLVALAYAVHAPDADADYAKVTDELNKEAAAPASQATDSSWTYAEFAEVLARGNVPLAMQFLPKVPDNARWNAAQQIVSELVRTNPEGALAVFRTLDKDNSRSAYFYGASLAQVLPIIYKTDSGGAVTLAEAVPDLQNRAQALTVIADLLPLTQAKPLYEEAETDSVDQMNQQGSTPASIAAHAYLRDNALGAELFQKAFDKVIVTATLNGQPYQSPSIPEFAFYYSRYDPGYSRLLLEDQFASDLKQLNQYYGQDSGASADVVAMAAIDPSRAQEMLTDIADINTRLWAGLKIAEYMMLSDTMRKTLCFSDWCNDSWTPTMSNVW